MERKERLYWGGLVEVVLRRAWLGDYGSDKSASSEEVFVCGVPRNFRVNMRTGVSELT